MNRQELEQAVIAHYLGHCMDTQEALFAFAVGVMSTDSLRTMVEVMKIHAVTKHSVDGSKLQECR